MTEPLNSESETNTTEPVRAEPTPSSAPETSDQMTEDHTVTSSSSTADNPTALEAMTAERDQIKDQMLRIAADFDNFRKRTRRDLENASHKGKEEALLELLPVVDNLERAIQAANETQDIKSLLEGIQMVLRLFDDSIRRLGIKRIATVGQVFDPNIHEALQQQPTADHPPGTIVTEVQSGYTLGSRVLRAALVIVARPLDVSSSIAEENSTSDQENLSDVKEPTNQ